MGKLVTPEVYLVGYSVIDMDGLIAYLAASGNEDFRNDLQLARESGLDDGEIMTSLFAKLCYASVTSGKNDNLTRIRDIRDNLIGTIDHGHGSVWEHCNLNFIARNCSRVFTHELVRHRVGTAFSQTSGRYVRGDKVDIVFDPILEPIRDQVEKVQQYLEIAYNQMVQDMGLDSMKDFTLKKKITSALRRILPNGQSNEIAFSCNLRTIRHIIQIRTSRHAEWEIRFLFDAVYKLLKNKFSLLFYGAKEEVVEGLVEVTGMKLQPYER